MYPPVEKKKSCRSVRTTCRTTQIIMFEIGTARTTCRTTQIFWFWNCEGAHDQPDYSDNLFWNWEGAHDLPDYSLNTTTHPPTCSFSYWKRWVASAASIQMRSQHTCTARAQSALSAWEEGVLLIRANFCFWYQHSTVLSARSMTCDKARTSPNGRPNPRCYTGRLSLT